MTFNFNSNAVPMMSPGGAGAGGAAAGHASTSNAFAYHNNEHTPATGTDHQPFTQAGQGQYGQGQGQYGNAAFATTPNAHSFSSSNTNAHYGQHPGHPMTPVHTMTAFGSSNNTQVSSAIPPHDAERDQTHVKKIMEFVDDPTGVCNELAAHSGKPRAAAIVQEIAAYRPFLDRFVQQKRDEMVRWKAEIKRQESEMKRQESEMKRQERELKQIVKAAKTLKTDTQPFVEQVAGYSSSDLVLFPSKQILPLVSTWIETRIKNGAKNGTLYQCTIPQLQAIFGLTDYSSLNNLSHDQLVMVLSYLHQKDFSRGRFFEEQMAKCTEESIIPSSGFNTNIIYHAGKNHYTENYHRALCAIYLGLLGDGMSQFTFAIGGGPKPCPWEIPGREYVSSCQLREERERER